MTLKYSQHQPPNHYFSNRESRSVLKERLTNLQKTNDHNLNKDKPLNSYFSDFKPLLSPSQGNKKEINILLGQTTNLNKLLMPINQVFSNKKNNNSRNNQSNYNQFHLVQVPEFEGPRSKSVLFNGFQTSQNETSKKINSILSNREQSQIIQKETTAATSQKGFGSHENSNFQQNNTFIASQQNIQNYLNINYQGSQKQGPFFGQRQNMNSPTLYKNWDAQSQNSNFSALSLTRYFDKIGLSGKKNIINNSRRKLMEARNQASSIKQILKNQNQLEKELLDKKITDQYEEYLNSTNKIEQQYIQEIQKNKDKKVQIDKKDENLLKAERYLQYIQTNRTDAQNKNIQYKINRQEVKVSEIPIEAIFNPKIDRIKQNEINNELDIAPLTFQYFDYSYQQKEKVIPKNNCKVEFNAQFKVMQKKNQEEQLRKQLQDEQNAHFNNLYQSQVKANEEKEQTSDDDPYEYKYYKGETKLEEEVDEEEERISNLQGYTIVNIRCEEKDICTNYYFKK